MAPGQGYHEDTTNQAEEGEMTNYAVTVLALVATLLSHGLARAESWVIPDGWARQAAVIYLAGFDPDAPG